MTFNIAFYISNLLLYLAKPLNLAHFIFHLGLGSKQKPKLNHLSQDIFFTFIFNYYTNTI
ncbi:MAG TPA: hypothetical protein PK762_02965 [Candidatus Kapabacteria bacterium]|nr:hypothetical protein [Candidatus Kapabacteria bacterium]